MTQEREAIQQYVEAKGWSVEGREHHIVYDVWQAAQTPLLATIAALEAERTSMLETKREQLAAKDARIKELEAKLSKRSYIFDGADNSVRQATCENCDQLRADLGMAVEALNEWDELIKHQYSGSREAMSDMTYAAQHGQELLAHLAKYGEG